MLDSNNIEIHETAFVTSTFRATDVILSKDVFAYLWRNPKTEKWIREYLKKVSSEETFTHCLRNRYFLESIKENIGTNGIEVLINFGAGFSMYPFLLDKKTINIEIDKWEVVEYKKPKIEQWQKTNVLPKRNLHFIGVDFSTAYKDALLTTIKAIKGNKKCFILIEGVLFFLDREETDNLFDLFNSIQNTGDIIGSASFQDELKESLAFKRLLRFFGEKVAKTKASDYQTVKDEFYQRRANYSLMDHQDYFSLSKTYNHKIRLQKELILNENFYLLQKMKS
ncbi:adenosine deaminase [Arenibacter sp. N53]|uniref:class I SAM-dependent methyltransferase n=1 Tax=Arenibacter TaxID=178469 RepID=UPI000CD3C695|nr:MULTISPECIES: class I SAM-dependent methyltransferase [Arenibacter]MCM4151023.1 adenosine deaminase [Arenibacter sp. N53]